MKKLRFFIFGLLVMAGVCQAQATPPAIAEAITPEIQALADGLQDDPVRIFNYVHDHIRYVLYFGSEKGAELTLLEKSGNDFDQCALLVALLRAAGYPNAAYQFGWTVLPYNNPDGSNRDLQHWLGLSQPASATNWVTTTNYLQNLIYTNRFFPGNLYAGGWPNNYFGLQRVWVTLGIGATNYLLDPSFKVSVPISGINLTNAMGFTSNNLMSVAGGTDTGNYVSNLNEARIYGTLTGYTTNLLNYLQSNCPNASVAQIIGGQSILPSTITTLSQSLLFAPTNLAGLMPVTNWVNEPASMMSTFSITCPGFTTNFLIPQLQGQRLALTINSSGSATLWLEDSNIATWNAGTGGGFVMNNLVYHPGLYGGWNYTNNSFIPGSIAFGYQAYYRWASAYALVYALEPDWGWLQERENKLAGYLQAGDSLTSTQVVCETLNIMGLNWMLQSESAYQLLAGQLGVLPHFANRLGRMAQESGHGYYVDVYGQTDLSVASSSIDPENGYGFYDAYIKQSYIWAYFSSALESGMIEQLQATNLTAVSTVKILELANTNHQAIYLATAANWSAVEPLLINYGTADLYNNYIDQGEALLLPQNGLLSATTNANSWLGYGFEGVGDVAETAGDYQMEIGPGEYNGGYSSDLSATVDPGFIDFSGISQPTFFSLAPPSLPSLTGADPVEMADGTFQVQTPDLSMGGTEPRGLNLSRYYSSSRRSSNLAGLAPGWLHNYYLNAATVSAPQASLGGTTPAQAAAMIVATTTAVNIFSYAEPDPKNWLATALVAKWGTDQLAAKAVSVSLGQGTYQFVRQPNGAYTPPANCTMTLLPTNGVYWLQERHGRTFQFNSAGWATSIVDPYNQSLSLTYNASNLVQTVTDWQSRKLTFTYNHGTSNQLISVADNSSPARTVSYGYSTNGDLTSVIDPQGSTNTFRYDTNHQIIATFNAAGQIVASNIYNAFGRVTTQYTAGNTNEMWRIAWSGWETVSQDPAGGRHTYFYDDQTRLIAQEDALGNLSQTVYDGQSHITSTVSPLGETNQFLYDGNHNLLAQIDPLGHTHQFFYDGQNNLIRALDANNHPTTFGYNAQFSLIGQTNGAGDWVNYGFNSDGTLAGRGDSGGVTKYGYDTYGQVNLITYTNSLGSDGFSNSYLGDVVIHTDPRGFATSYQYNKRRQLISSTATNNLTNGITYDAVGNTLTATDARGNALTNAWSATRHLLATQLPATPQGAPLATNIYDVRDWLVQTLDPYQKTTTYSNDPAGRLILITDPVQHSASMIYDADGHPLSTANAASETNSQTWDARGLRLSQTDGAGHSIIFRNDAAGNQVTLTNRNGKGWQFYFDAANRLTGTVSPLNRSNSIGYNHQGLVAYTTDPSNQLSSFYYDAKGRLTNRTDPLATTTYGHDLNDNLTSVTEGSLSNVWTYDAYNRVNSYQNVNGCSVQYRYDANGNLTNLVYPGTRNVYYAYDALNRLTNVTDWASRKTTLAYDLNGHLTTLTRPNGTYRTISYDAAGEVTNIWEQMANNLPIAWFRLNWANSGNLAWEFAAPLPHTNATNTPPTRTMIYDADNRLLTVNSTSVTSDLDGNLTYGPLPMGSLTTAYFTNLSYDARNRLLNASGVVNTYDALNNRVGQTVGTNNTTYVVNPNAALPQVLMRVKSGVTTYYIYGAGLMYQISEAATTTNTLSYHYDYRGSTIALSADNGLVTDRMEYALYGLTTFRAGTNDTPFLFNGQYGVQTDANGLLYMGARYYNPYLCRFVSADPSGFSGGLNMYAYANGNPASYLDPFGLGALGESALTSSWFNAPTEEQTAIQNNLADVVNLLALGIADQASTYFSRKDLYGNTTTPEEQQAAGINLAAVLIPVVDVEAVGSRAAMGVADALAGAAEETAAGSKALVPYYPPNQGFAGASGEASLVPGTVVDRYGGTGGSFLSPAGTPVAARSLPFGTENLPLNSYQVMQPINVNAGTAAPWFNQLGGGLQFDLGTSTVQDLINSGHLKPLP